MKAVADEQLIRWVADGDSSCLATLFERHHRGVYRYFRQMLGDRALCEDLVQDVFLKVLRKAKTFRGHGSFKGWLYNVARNAALDELRKHGHRPVEISEEDGMNEHLTDHRSAERDAAGQQKAARVLEALARLPAAAREVIWLGRFEFDSYEALGQALDCNAGAARVRMHRAMALLNTTYMDMNGAPVDG